MRLLCHRCQGELPQRLAGDDHEPYSQADDERALFCPRCGAPQIRLPEYMRVESANDGNKTTGTVPPPRPRRVEWNVALLCAVPISVITGVLAVLAWIAPGASFLNLLCVAGGAGIVLALYRTRRPLARVDGGVGVRIGLVTGLMMISCMGIALAAAGVVDRFGLHRMGGFDQQVGQQFQDFQTQWTASMQQQGQSPAMQAYPSSHLEVPEVRAGFMLAGLALEAAIILAITTACGGFTGMLQTRRRAVRGGR